MPSHSESRVLPWRPEQLYRLVADIEAYPEFLPWCSAVRVKRLGENARLAEMVISFKIYRERYRCKVEATPESAIDVSYVDGPFRHMTNHWRFTEDPGGCRVDFFVDFEFKSRVLQKLIGLLFHEAVARMVSAFEGRARELYGPGAPAPLSAAQQRRSEQGA